MKKSFGLLFITILALMGESFSFDKNVSLKASENDTVNIVDMIEKLYLEKVSAEESDFLLKRVDYSITLPDLDSANNVNSALIDNKLVVEVKPISNSYGTYIPTGIIYNDVVNDLSFFNDTYINLDIDYVSGVDDFEVSYDFTYELNKDILDNAINLTYISTEYYYRVYQYLNSNNSYTKYLADLEIYNSQLLSYQKYLTQLEEYNKYVNDLAAYNAYLVDLANYNAEKDYLADPNNLEEVAIANQAKHCLDVMDIAFAPMNLIDVSLSESGTRTLYNSIIGDTVTSVLEGQDELIGALGAPREWLNECSEATNYLREVLENYNNRTTKKDKYTYFVQIYSNLFKNVYKLFRNLDALFRLAKVQKAVETKGKIPQFQLLIGQLAYFTRALAKGSGENKQKIYNKEAYDSLGRIDLTKPNAKIVDDTWTFRGHTIEELIGGYKVDISISGEPIGNVYKVLDSNLKVPIEVKTPTIVSEPIKVEEPVPPIHPSENEEPVPPQGITKLKNLSTKQRNLAKLFEEGYFKERLHLDKYFYTYTNFAKYNVSKENKVAVYFSESALFNLEFFSINPTSNKTPTKQGDSFYTDYSFKEWVDSNGIKVNFEDLNTSCKLYANFVGDNPIKYSITWVIDGKIYNDEFAAGTIPICDHPITKEDVGDKYYVFDHWDKELVSVSQNETYTAVFTEKTKILIRFYGHDGLVESRKIKEGDIVIPPKLEDIEKEDYCLKFIGWYSTFENITKNSDFNAIYFRLDYYVLKYKDNSGNDVSKKCFAADIPTDMEDNIYYDLAYKYTFNNWNILNLDAIALYKKEKIFKDNSVASLNDGELIIDAKNNFNNSIDVSNLSIAYSELFNDVNFVTLKFKDYSLRMSVSSFKTLLYSGANSINLDVSNTDGNAIFSLKVTDSNNSFINSTINAEIIHAFKANKIKLKYDNNVEILSVENDKITFPIILNKSYSFYEINAISIIENSKVQVISPLEGAFGDLIKLQFVSDNAYNLDEVIIKTDSGKIVLLENNEFVMPNENISISTKTSEKIFTITFLLDDEIYSSATYKYGEELIVPDDPNKFPSDGIAYQFAGWDIADFVVKENKTYIAHFTTSKVRDVVLMAVLNSLFSIILSFSCCILCTLLYIITKKLTPKGRKKREKFPR